MVSRRDPVTGLVRRGVSNGNERGGTPARRARKIFLLETYRADVDVIVVGGVTFDDIEAALDRVMEHGLPYEYHPYPQRRGMGYWTVPHGYGEMAARCYRCGILLTFETMTVDRIVPGCQKTAAFPKGGTYRRNNIRPCCAKHNSETGGALAKDKTIKKVTGRRGHLKPVDPA